MTSLALTKHHGLGNDFLVVFDPDVADPADLARSVCDRRTGIGADGLLVGTAAEGYTARMTLYNADGARGSLSTSWPARIGGMASRWIGVGSS